MPKALFKFFKPKLLIPMAVSLFLIGKAYYDTNSLEINHYQISNKEIGKILNGKKLAFLTDLHIRNYGLIENKILEIIEKEKPDLILLGGDYINFKGSFQPAISFMEKLKAPLGVYGVLGNTEYSNENGSCILCHKNGSKIIKENPHPRFLRNSSTILNIDEKRLNLIGVDDPVNGKADLTAALTNCSTKVPSILISHSPQIFEDAVQKGVSFILSGHNHGGQIFLLKYLRDALHLDPALEFLEGFFQKGKTTMYVSRGLGTSFLPFRFGVKPEISFFTFCDEHAESKSLFAVNKNQNKSIFMGFKFDNFLSLFNFSNILFNSQSPDDKCLKPYDNKLFDFESDVDLNYLNWECYKWFERSKEYATSGKYSLKVCLPPGPYPGINFKNIRENWSKNQYLMMDVINPSKEEFIFHIRIDDHKSGWEYADRFDMDFLLRNGLNKIRIPLSSIKTNIGNRPLDLRNIKRLMVFIPHNLKKRELYIDYIRLE